jgi:hypothetical protein
VAKATAMSQPLSISGPTLKLRRAQEHLDTFDDLADPFIATETSRITRRFDPQHKVVLFELQPTPTPREWGPIIGDALFNCRSALDQFANVLAGGDPSDRVTAFPVCASEAMFSSAKTQGELSHMSPDAVALVEEAQPYRSTRTDHPEYDELWVLHELCNTDKHRALHLTSLGFEGASSRGEVQIAGLNFGLMSAVIGTIPLAAVSVSSPDEDVPLSLHLEVAFADVLRWKMPVGVSRFLEDVIEAIRVVFAFGLKRELVAP